MAVSGVSTVNVFWLPGPQALRPWETYGKIRDVNILSSVIKGSSLSVAITPRKSSLAITPILLLIFDMIFPAKITGVIYKYAYCFQTLKTMATLVKGCVFGEIQIWISDSKNESWSLKSTLWVESRIKSKSGFLRFTIWAFFWERIWRKYFSQAVFWTKMFDFLTDQLMAPLLWAIGYISFRVCLLFTFVDYFITLTCPVFCTYVVSAYARLFSKFKKRKNNSSANSVRCFLLGKRLTFKPKYAHFVHSYVSLRRFPSCLRLENHVVFLLFSSSRGARGHAVVSA